MIFMANSIEYYLSRGMDVNMARYFASGRRTLVSAVPRGDFTLILTFDNGEKRVLDCKPFIKEGTVFSFLSDYKNFERVYIDNQNCVAWDIDPSIDSNVVWNNKVDLCSDSCYVDSIPSEVV